MIFCAFSVFFFKFSDDSGDGYGIMCGMPAV